MKVIIDYQCSWFEYFSKPWSYLISWQCKQTYAFWRNISYLEKIPANGLKKCANIWGSLIILSNGITTGLYKFNEYEITWLDLNIPSFYVYSKVKFMGWLHFYNYVSQLFVMAQFVCCNNTSINHYNVSFYWS